MLSTDKVTDYVHKQHQQRLLSPSPPLQSIQCTPKKLTLVERSKKTPLKISTPHSVSLDVREMHDLLRQVEQTGI